MKNKIITTYEFYSARYSITFDEYFLFFRSLYFATHEVCSGFSPESSSNNFPLKHSRCLSLMEKNLALYDYIIFCFEFNDIGNLDYDAFCALSMSSSRFRHANAENGAIIWLLNHTHYN